MIIFQSYNNFYLKFYFNNKRMRRKFIFLGLLTMIVAACSNEPSSSISIANSQLYLASAQQKPVQKSTKPDEGKAVFEKYCLMCHQKDGSGVPPMYPPVKKSDWVTGDKKRLVKILLNGLQGEITVSGETYSAAMPKQDFLTNRQIAQVLTYVRQNFGNKADSVKVKDVMMIRK